MATKTLELKSQFPREAAAVADRPAVSYLWCEFNANASKFLNYFLQVLRFPHFYRRVVNRSAHPRRFSQSEQHLGNVLDVHERKDRLWREWDVDRFPLRTFFKNLRTPWRRGLPNTRPNNSGNA